MSENTGTVRPPGTGGLPPIPPSAGWRAGAPDGRSSAASRIRSQ